MTELLETIMLLCFGFSWPVSLLKNLRAKSAKSTSVAFMCLILAGYLAGIAAKVMTVGCNVVFFVYLFNVTMVLLNLLVTLRYRKKEAAVRTPSATPSISVNVQPCTGE